MPPRGSYIAPNGSKPWERRTGESAKAFEAWLTYLDLPDNERSLSRLASDLNRSNQLVAGWSRQWGWQQRLGEWRQHLDREKQSAALEASRASGIRQATQLEALERVLFEPAQVLLRRIAAGQAQLEEFSTRDLFELSILAARAYPRLVVAERLVRGQATEIVEHEVDEASRVVMDEDWVRKFHAGAELLGIPLEDLVALPPASEVIDADEVPPPPP